MPSKEDDLLARLNALKPSSVKLEQESNTIDIETTRPQTREDRLAERLKQLRDGDAASKSNVPRSEARDPGPLVPSQSPPVSLDPVEALTKHTRDELSVERDPIRHWQQQPDDEQTLEELLAELGPSEGSKLAWLDPEDPQHINSLLKEAKEALPTEPETKPSRGQALSEQGNISDHAETESQKSDDQQDEADADEYIKKVLADLDLEQKYGETEPPEQDPGHVPSPSLNLPSTPSQLKDTPATSEPLSHEDSELEARFAKLGLNGLNLPSTPTTKPSATKPTVQASLKTKPKSTLPTYTDEDIDSWCCICNDDGQMRCLGCDNDIYCQNCWHDGHGNAPGQERGHRAVQYNRKPPPATAA